MEISYTTEQQLLADTIKRLLDDTYDFTARQKYRGQGDGWSRDVWASLAREGFLGVLVPAEYDGYGGSFVDAMLVMQALGRHLALEPYLPTALLAAPVVAAHGTDAHRQRYLPSLMGGSTIAAFAHAEGDGREVGADFAVRARGKGHAFRLNGEKCLVVAGGTADILLVTGRAEDGPGLFIVDAADAGVTRVPYRLRDGLSVADVSFSEAAAERIGGAEAVGFCIDRALAGLVAEGVGAMSAAFDVALEHLRTRQQFGKPIGANQALQHRAAEMMVSVELCRSMAMLAAGLVDTGDASLRATRLAQAKAIIGKHGRTVCEAAVQMHGGMGVIEEHSAGVYYKRLIAIDNSFGNADHHLAQLAKNAA